MHPFKSLWNWLFPPKPATKTRTMTPAMEQAFAGPHGFKSDALAEAVRRAAGVSHGSAAPTPAVNPQPGQVTASAPQQAGASPVPNVSGFTAQQVQRALSSMTGKNTAGGPEIDQYALSNMLVQTVLLARGLGDGMRASGITAQQMGQAIASFRRGVIPFAKVADALTEYAVTQGEGFQRGIKDAKILVENARSRANYEVARLLPHEIREKVAVGANIAYVPDEVSERMHGRLIVAAQVLHADFTAMCGELPPSVLADIGLSGLLNEDGSEKRPISAAESSLSEFLDG